MAIKAIGFGVNAVLEQKPDVRDKNKESNSKRVLTTSQMWRLLQFRRVVEAMEIFIQSEIDERNVAKPKKGDEQFKEPMDRWIARRDIGKNRKVTELRSEALEETANSKLEDDAILGEGSF